MRRRATGHRSAIAHGVKEPPWQRTEGAFAVQQRTSQQAGFPSRCVPSVPFAVLLSSEPVACLLESNNVV